MGPSRFGARAVWEAHAADIAYAAACAWLLASFIDHNFAQLASGVHGTLTQVYASVALLLVSGYTLAAVLALRSPQRRRTALSTLTLTLIMLFVLFAPLRGLLRDWAGPGRASLVSTVAIIGLAAGAWPLSRRPGFRTALALAMLGAFAVATGSLVVKVAVLPPQHIPTVSPSQDGDLLVSPAGAVGGENIYYIITDEYGRHDVLAKVLELDNSSFLHAMEGRGFFVADRARSSYTTTYLTLMALLEANYPVEPGIPKYSDERDFYPAALNAGRTPRALNAMRNLGYTTVQVDNFWSGCQNRVFDQCHIASHSQFSYPLRAFLAMTPAPSLLSFIQRTTGGGRSAMQVVRGLALPDRPVFVFAHHMAPHPEYTFTADCSPQSPPGGQLPPAVEKALYRDAVSCVNRMALDLVDTIIQRDPTAIIVIQADHGSAFTVDWSKPVAAWSEQSLWERSAILNLIRMPAACRQWLYSEIGTVNTMRAVIACVQRRQPAYVEERSFLSLYERNPDFGLIAPITLPPGNLK